MGFLRLRCVACESNIVSQAKVNLNDICWGSGCHLTEECWLICGPGEILLLFTGSVKMVMMFAPCGDRGRPHHVLC